MRMVKINGVYGIDFETGAILTNSNLGVGITHALKLPAIPFRIELGEVFSHDGFVLIQHTIYAKKAGTDTMFYLGEDDTLQIVESNKKEALLLIPEETHASIR